MKELLLAVSLSNEHLPGVVEVHRLRPFATPQLSLQSELDVLHCELDRVPRGAFQFHLGEGEERFRSRPLPRPAASFQG